MISKEKSEDYRSKLIAYGKEALSRNAIPQRDIDWDLAYSDSAYRAITELQLPKIALKKQEQKAVIAIEMACGNGRSAHPVIHHLRKLYGNKVNIYYFGVDICPKSINRAKKLENILSNRQTHVEFHQGDASNKKSIKNILEKNNLTKAHYCFFFNPGLCRFTAHFSSSLSNINKAFEKMFTHVVPDILHENGTIFISTFSNNERAQAQKLLNGVIQENTSTIKDNGSGWKSYNINYSASILYENVKFKPEDKRQYRHIDNSPMSLLRAGKEAVQSHSTIIKILLLFTAVLIIASVDYYLFSKMLAVIDKMLSAASDNPSVEKLTQIRDEEEHGFYIDVPVEHLPADYDFGANININNGP